MTPPLPDLYDPPEDLEEPTPLPLYHVEGTGSFAALRGEVCHTSGGARHLEGRRIVEVLTECLDMDVDVLAVEPGRTHWKPWNRHGV